jgi:hypothetical protein
MLNTIMICVLMLDVVKPSVVVMPTVDMLGAVLLIVVAPTLKLTSCHPQKRKKSLLHCHQQG